jgi:hypothetical protein
MCFSARNFTGISAGTPVSHTTTRKYKSQGFQNRRYLADWSRHEKVIACGTTSGVPNLGRTQFGPKLTHALCRETNAINEVTDYIITFLRCLNAPNARLLRLQ